MATVQIRDVPPDIHAVLRSRAAAAGKSLQEYLLERLSSEARRPTIEEVLARAGQRAGGEVTFESAVNAVRNDRESR